MGRGTSGMLASKRNLTLHLASFVGASQAPHAGSVQRRVCLILNHTMSRTIVRHSYDRHSLVAEPRRQLSLPVVGTGVW